MSHCNKVVHLLPVLLLLGCLPSRVPERPVNVPVDAVLTGGDKTGWRWIKCGLANNENTCTIFNRSGVILREGVYKPYDGGPPVAVPELRIRPAGSNLGLVYLEDGRILILASDFDWQKEVLDIERGVRRSP